MMNIVQQPSMCSMWGLRLLMRENVLGLTHLCHLLLCCWVIAHCYSASRRRLAFNGLQR